MRVTPAPGQPLLDEERCTAAVRADFRAPHPIDRDKIIGALTSLMDSVEFGN